MPVVEHGLTRGEREQVLNVANQLELDVGLTVSPLVCDVAR
jgi:hypothetical protein